MKPNIIFLDIDGVLNTTVSAEWDKKIFCPTSVEFIRKLIEHHNCQVVVSSTWRHGMSGWQMMQLLHVAGLGQQCLFMCKSGKVAPMGSKPDESWKTDNEGNIRGDEIQRWLDKYGNEIREYVIIDDDRDMTETQMGHFVHTDHFTGFGFREFNQALIILGDSAAVDTPQLPLTPVRELEKRVERLLDGYREIVREYPDTEELVETLKKEKW